MIHHLLTRILLSAALAGTVFSSQVNGEGDWEITEGSERALSRGIGWLQRNQGAEGNWKTDDLGLVGMGALAFMANGDSPGRGKNGDALERSLDHILSNAKPSGLLNITSAQRDMYNHGLTTFVLGQAHGMTNDPRINSVLDRALRLIANTQCDDGGWDYRAHRQTNGHDLSLVVMQAKALRSAVDSGLEVPPEVIELAIRSVKSHYRPAKGDRNASEAEQKKHAGQFTYARNGGKASTAMAAAGVVCLQEFGQYDDWRIRKNMDVINAKIEELKNRKRSHNGDLPFDAYTLYYVGQALYQAGGEDWERSYPILRDYIVESQIISPDNPAEHGKWRAVSHVGGQPGDLYGTSVACFILAMPNRYLPILQEGHIEGLRDQFKAP
ncbi:MAG: squalene--hopene cyclase [Pirellulales bacterium]